MPMRVLLIIIIFWVNGLVGQSPNYAIQQHERQWKEYTTFQRMELISYCDFLYEKEQYDRAILGMFQFLYLFPGDSLEAVITYRIANSYLATGKNDEAHDYYNRTLALTDSTADLHRLAWRRSLSILVAENRYDSVLTLLTTADDPFDITVRGYVHLHRLEWEAARQAFKAAEASFNSPYYSRQLRPLFEALDGVRRLPRRNKPLTVLSALIPGGGFAYLGNRESAAAALATVTGLGIAAYFYRDEPAVMVPIALTGLAVYGGSFWKATSSVRSTNIANQRSYIEYIIRRYPVQRLIALDEPDLF